MIYRPILFFFLILPLSAFPADKTGDIKQRNVQIGLRSTTGLFNDAGAAAFGTGGQFRIRMGKRLNTEWFADYITTNIEDLAIRADYHIGWSVMVYPFNAEYKKGIFSPYILAGHCFDYTRVQKSSSPDPAVSRWSSAIQSGLGTHYCFSDRFDLSFSAQYMIHLGNYVDVQVSRNLSYPPEVLINQDAKLSLEGHLLLTLSMNVKIFSF